MVLEQLNIHFKKWTSYHIQKLTQNGAQTQNVKPETRQLLGENLCHLEWGNDFLDMTPEAQSITAESDKLDCVESENFCSSTYVREWKKKSIDLEKIYASHMSDKVPRICKELSKFNNKEKPNLKNGTPKEIYRWQKSTWKDAQ